MLATSIPRHSRKRPQNLAGFLAALPTFGQPSPRPSAQASRSIWKSTACNLCSNAVQKADAKNSMPVADQFYGMKEFTFEGLSQEKLFPVLVRRS
jgi:hypothetical protein